MVLAILSIAIGSIVALMQTNIKRLLAYSTITYVVFERFEISASRKTLSAKQQCLNPYNMKIR
jgi:NADH:ubiquinone oxidoreductase subunit 2 (subunit N)